MYVVPFEEVDSVLDKEANDFADKLRDEGISRDDLKTKQYINIKDLLASQDIVSKSAVDEMLESKKSVQEFTENGNNVYVYKYDGKYIIQNGHHRATVAYLRGDNQLLCDVIDLDSVRQPQPKTIQEIAAERHAKRNNADIQARWNARFAEQFKSLPTFATSAPKASVDNEAKTMIANLELIYGTSHPRYTQIRGMKTSITKYGGNKTQLSLMRSWLNVDNISLDYELVTKHGLDFSHLSDMPHEWRIKMEALNKKISSVDLKTDGLISVIRDYSHISNMCRIAASDKAVAIGLDKISFNTPSQIFYEFEDKFPGFSSKFLPKKAFFDMLPHYVPLNTDAVGGCCYDRATDAVKISLTNTKTLKRLKSDYYKQSIFYHEYGHAIDILGGWRSDPELLKLFDKLSASVEKKKN